MNTQFFFPLFFCELLYKVSAIERFFFQLVLISWIATLRSCLIWQIISSIPPLNEYGCVYAWTTLGSGPAIDLQKMTILAKESPYLFRWSSFWSLRVCKQAKLSHLGHRKPARIIEKRVTVWCGFWSRGIIGTFFFEYEQGEAVTVNGDRNRAVLNEFLFTKISVLPSKISVTPTSQKQLTL